MNQIQSASNLKSLETGTGLNLNVLVANKYRLLQLWLTLYLAMLVYYIGISQWGIVYYVGISGPCVVDSTAKWRVKNIIRDLVFCFVILFFIFLFVCFFLFFLKIWLCNTFSCWSRFAFKVLFLRYCTKQR